MVAGSFVAEILKLGKRPSTWVLAAILLLGLILLDYLLSYALANALQNQGASSSGTPAPPGGLVESLKSNLFPPRIPANVIGFITSFGAPIVLIFGALVAGSEYRWGTLAAVLTRRQSRLSFLLGKFLAAGVMLLVLCLLALVSGTIISYVLAGIEGAPADGPSFWDVLRALGIGWLILEAWASLGFFLAVLFRGTALAIGLGLVYALVLEGTISGLTAQVETLSGVRDALLGKNSVDLAGSLARDPQGFAPPDAVDPAQAALVLAAYVVVSLLLAMLLFRQRDVA